MENELECLGGRKGHDDHLAKNFLKRYWAVCTNRGIALKKLFHSISGKAFAFKQLLRGLSNCSNLEQLL